VIGRAASITDPGRKRRHNEDAFVFEPPLFAIADGMGGAQAGEVASRLAAAALRESGAHTGGEQRIVDLIQEANRRVYDRSSTDPNTFGMGTTITVALVEDGRVAFGHVGDSRAYLIREGVMEQVTEDHSLVNELLKSGKLSPEEAESHPQKSVITRALGTDPDVDVDTFTIEAVDGDLFLLCSDGLTDMVEEATILELVERSRSDIDAALKALVRAANRGGGEDNITVVAFEITDAPVHDGETQEQALPTEPTIVPADDEDTLDEHDRVPVVQTAVVSAAEIERHLAEEKRARRRQRRRRILAWLGLVAFLAVIAALVVWRLFS
jgi:serine/threonine protein phosphatase PrpC